MTNHQRTMGWGRIVLAGIVASIAMAVTHMVLEDMDGDGFWAPIIYLAAALLRDYQTVAVDPAFEASPVFLGIMLHLVISLVLAVIFGAITVLVTRNAWLLMLLGVAYGLVVFAIAYYALVPAANEVMERLNAGYFALSSVMWGLWAGLIIGWPVRQPDVLPTHEETQQEPSPYQAVPYDDAAAPPAPDALHEPQALHAAYAAESAEVHTRTLRCPLCKMQQRVAQAPGTRYQCVNDSCDFNGPLP